MLDGPAGVGDVEHYLLLAADARGDRGSAARGPADARHLPRCPARGPCARCRRTSATGRQEIGYGPLTPHRGWSGLGPRPLDGVPVLHWHGDQFEIPPGAVRLAETPRVPAPGRSSPGPAVLGLQFHPRRTTPGSRARLMGHTHGSSRAPGSILAGPRRRPSSNGPALAGRGQARPRRLGRAEHAAPGEPRPSTDSDPWGHPRPPDRSTSPTGRHAPSRTSPERWTPRYLDRGRRRRGRTQPGHRTAAGGQQDRARGPDPPGRRRGARPPGREQGAGGSSGKSENLADLDVEWAAIGHLQDEQGQGDVAAFATEFQAPRLAPCRAGARTGGSRRWAGPRRPGPGQHLGRAQQVRPRPRGGARLRPGAADVHGPEGPRTHDPGRAHHGPRARPGVPPGCGRSATGSATRRRRAGLDELDGHVR